MGYTNQPSEPEWDEQMKVVVANHSTHCERVVHDLAAGMPSKFIISRELFAESLRHAFEGGLEAITKEITNEYYENTPPANPI